MIDNGTPRQKNLPYSRRQQKEKDSEFFQGIVYDNYSGGAGLCRL